MKRVIHSSMGNYLKVFMTEKFNQQLSGLNQEEEYCLRRFVNEAKVGVVNIKNVEETHGKRYTKVCGLNLFFRELTFRKTYKYLILDYMIKLPEDEMKAG